MSSRGNSAVAAPPSRRGAGGRKRARAAFTTFEAILATTIIGLGFVAMVNLIAVDTRNNREGTELTTGVNLARNIREMSITMKYADQLGLNGASYTPPKDSRGVTLNDFVNWQQVVTVQGVSPTDPTTTVPDTNPAAVRMTTTVSHNGKQVCSLSWYVFKRF